MMQQIMDIRARNAGIQMRSAEKARKGKPSGPVNCSPESVMIKHNHNYVNPEDFPDIGQGPVNTAYYKVSERHQPLRNVDTPRGHVYQSTQSPPQYYYTQEPIQEGANYTRVKLEPHSDPT